MTKILQTSFAKRLLITLLSVGVCAHLSGCGSTGSTEEEGAGGEETFAEESSGDFADGEGAETADAGDSEAPKEGDAAAGEDDLSSEMADADGDKKEGGTDEMSLDGDAAGKDVAAADAAGDDLSLDDDQGLPEDVAKNGATAEPTPIAETPPTADTPPTDAPVFADNGEATAGTAAPDSGATAPVDAAPTSWVPLKKIKTAAFEANGANLNRVYVARDGDTRASIAEMIYNDKKKSKDLLKWNSFLGRGVKTGDKIYYSSPTNATDANMLTYYEDIGVPAQNYTSKEGDNIREVAKSLLGENESWKELWATNADIESKGDIPAGINIRYWPKGSAVAIPVAENPPPTDPVAQAVDPAQPPTDPLAQPPADPTLAQNPVQPPTDPLQPPTPPVDPVAQPTATPASVAQTDPIQPPPPPPPPKDPPVAQAGESSDANAEADNMMMMGLAGIVLLAAGAVFFLMRRSKSRKVDLTQTTQVG